jgi:uncharacterized membrane protein
MLTATAETKPLQHRKYRINSIDLLRGLVMIIMALDHARDLLHFGAMIEDPLNTQTTTPALFFTRWVTHFCAPVFVFLSGTSIYLQSLRKSKKELSSFLLKRGLWLILVEVILVTFGLTFDPSWTFIFLQVIWAIGISMVILAALILLPFSLLFTIGFVIVLGHNSLDYFEAKQQGPLPISYQLLHQQAFVPLNENHVLGILYPFLPWMGVMILGYCFGRIYETAKRAAVRRKRIFFIGLGTVVLFVSLRLINQYGDTQPWTEQRTPFYTFLSFLNTDKYPPSLMFTCMTLGPALLFLALMDNTRSRLAEVITVYGRVPFFYYILHFYMLHLAAVILFLAKGHSVGEGFKGVPNIPFKFVIPGEGLRLWQTYLVWLVVVALLYPLCKWFGRYKQRYKHWWLSYV